MRRSGLFAASWLSTPPRRPSRLLVTVLACALVGAISSGSARADSSPVDARWAALGGASGVLGDAVAAEHDVPGLTGARAREFEHGHIYWSAASGAWDVQEPVLARLLAVGGVTGPLGLPTGAAAAAGSRDDALRQVFRGGQVLSSPATGTRVLTGAVLARYVGTGGGPDGTLGLPTSEERSVTGGTLTSFEHGRIYRSSATGAHAMVAGAVLSRFVAAGGPAAYLGLPTTELYSVSAGKRQRFRYGSITYSSGARTTSVHGVWRPSVQRVTAAQVPYTYRSGCPVGPSSLRRIRVPYYDWAGNPRLGNLVARAGAVADLKAVFKRGFGKHFPIRRIDPVDVWRGSDVRAMAADNTSAFNCRKVTGNPYRLSQHSYGNAVDINTRENPYVTSSRVYPSGARTFLRRSDARKGMILKHGPIARGMRAHGWPWGARWAHPDYQHFSSNGG